MIEMVEQTVIIAEGPDRCGKTNIATELAHRIGVPYFKNKAEHQYFLKDPDYFIHAIRYVDTYFTSYLETTGASIILDRAWPSEWVYSQALGRKTDMAVLRDLDARHAALGTKLVIAHRTDYGGVRDEYQVVNDNIRRIHDLYMELASWTQCRCLLLNVDDENLEREISDIRRFVNK